MKAQTPTTDARTARSAGPQDVSHQPARDPLAPGLLSAPINKNGSQGAKMLPHTTGAAMTEKEAAGTLGLSVSTLRAWRHREKGPPFVKFGRAVRYLRIDLDAFMAASRVDTGEHSESDRSSESEEIVPR